VPSKPRSFMSPTPVPCKIRLCFFMLRRFWLGASMLRIGPLSNSRARLRPASHGEIGKTIEKIEGLLGPSGASLVYAGYPYDPYA
jgi:hypothetical protein